MSRKMSCLAILCLIFLTGATTAKAVTIDLSSSPPSGSTLYPGDTLVLSVTVTNDTAKKDFVFVWFSITIEGGGRPVVLGKARPLRLKLDSGESVTKTITATIPEFPPVLPLGLIDVTIEATAEGKKSKTTDTDSVYFFLNLLWPGC